MADVPHIAVKTVVVCDEVRREDNGKDILIGVYSAGALVAQFPAPLQFTFWIQFKGTGMGEVTIQFRLMGGEDVKFAEGKVQMTLLREGLGAIAIGPLPLILQVPTPLALQMKQATDVDWHTIEEIPVSKGAAVNPLTGVPPSFVPPQLSVAKPATD
jgi:hypothetical protein